MVLGLALTSHTLMLSFPIHQAAGATVSGRYFDNIVIVAMENQNYADVVGNGNGSSSAPFIASLLPQGATVPNYHGASCGGSSENSYLALISGNTWGCPGNGARDIGDTSTQTLVDKFETAGVSWRAFCESSCGRDGDHFPWIDFVTITSSSERMSHIDNSASTAQLVDAIGSANFIWFTPEDNHNMHDNSIDTGDSYLSGFVPQILSKTGFTSDRSLLMLWWDEYDPAPFLMVGPTVQQGYISSRNNIEHYTITKLIEENWELSSLTSNDASQASMSEFFATSPSPPGPSTNPPANQPPWLPTQVSDLWLILVGGVLGAVAGIAIFGVKSRHRKRPESAAEGGNDVSSTRQASSRRGAARRTKSNLINSVSKGKLVVAVCYATLLIVGALAVAGSLRATNVNAAVSGRYFDNIVVVAMENKNYNDVIGSASAPFINSLLPSAATIPNFHSYGASGRSIGGCSAGCYTAQISGSDQGISDGYSCCINAPTLMNLLTSAGLTWQAYCESGCPRGNDHFPFDGFADTVGSSNIHDGGSVSTSDFVTAANAANPVNFLWFTPTDNHNMHDNDVASGDAYVHDFLVGSGSLNSPASGSLFASPLLKSSRTLFVLWWDEYDPSPNLYRGSMVKQGYVSPSDSFDEFSVERMIEDNWGLTSYLGSDGVATGFAADILGSTPPPPPPGQLTASFTFNPTSPIIGQTVTFSGVATGGTPPYSFSWNFGDGLTGTGQTAAHVYNSANTFTVSLTVRDSPGTTDTATQTITVLSQPPPPPPNALSAEFTYSPQSPSVNQQITFTGVASGGIPPYSFAWDFGDLSSATGNAVQHSYSVNGAFTISVTVTDSANTESTTTMGITVAPQSNEILTSFSFRDPSSNDVSSAVTWQVWDGNNMVSAASQASLNPLRSYELRIFYQGHLIVSRDVTPQPTIRETMFMYSHHSTTDGYIVFNSTIDGFATTEESNSRLRFTAVGSQGPYTILIKVPRAPTAMLKDSSEYPYTYDSGQNVVVVETPSLSSWELDFASSTQPPSLCPFCPEIPSTSVSSLWLVFVGGMIGLTTSLAILTRRAHSKLQRARRLYTARAS